MLFDGDVAVERISLMDMTTEELHNLMEAKGFARGDAGGDADQGEDQCDAGGECGT